MVSRDFFKVFLSFILFFVHVLHSDASLQPDFTVMVPMRDGTELPTDLYLPDIEAEGLPCILLRCPAGRKAFPWRNYAKLSEKGYVVAIQDTRSALDPNGKIIPYLADGWGKEKDGYDAVEWLARSVFTNGKVGTIGFSAVGITQQMMAPSAPPSLMCQYIGVAAGSIYHHAAFPGGQLLKNQVEGWLGMYAKDPSVLRFLCSQPHYNEFWSRFDSISMAHHVSTPAIHYGGWYDTFIQGTLDSFQARQDRGGEGARGKQKLVVGPWTHHWPDNQELGDFKVPENAQKMPEDFHPAHWFDYHLKEAGNHVENMPAVTYYVMGPFDGTPSGGNVWRTADAWPVPSNKVSFYLRENNTIKEERPKEGEGEAYVFDCDPDDPVPTIGGRNLFIGSGPKPQNAIEERGDVVVFTSDPMEEELEITGRIIAELYFSSDTSNTDVAVRFCDVYPDGRSILIADGHFRTGLLHHGRPDAMVYDPHMLKKIEVDLWSTSLVVAKGHRLRVSISGSNYPRYEKNHNHPSLFSLEGQKPVVAHNKVFVGSKHPSRIVLPVTRKAGRELAAFP